MDEHFFSLLSMEKLLKKAGAPRVSEEAKELLRNYLEKKAESIAKEIVLVSEHSNRRTILGSDVNFVISLKEKN